MAGTNYGGESPWTVYSIQLMTSTISAVRNAIRILEDLLQCWQRRNAHHQPRHIDVSQQFTVGKKKFVNGWPKENVSRHSVDYYTSVNAPITPGIMLILKHRFKTDQAPFICCVQSLETDDWIRKGLKSLAAINDFLGWSLGDPWYYVRPFSKRLDKKKGEKYLPLDPRFHLPSPDDFPGVHFL